MRTPHPPLRGTFSPLGGEKALPLVLFTLTLAAALIPGSALELQRGGALWRIVTCHFTHFTYEQLAWDALTFLLLGTLCARRNLAFQATLFASVVAVPLAVLAFAPSIATYRGLSGIDSALFALLVFSSRNRIAIVCIALFAAKTLFEIATGSAVFASGDFIAVPVAHIAGAIVGAVASTLPSCACSRLPRRLCSRHCFSPRPQGAHSRIRHAISH